MSAVVMVVPRNDWKTVSKYLTAESGDGYLLVPEDIYDNLPPVEKKLIDGSFGAEGYNFDQSTSSSCVALCLRRIADLIRQQMRSESENI